MFIKTIPPEQATGRLATIYDRVKDPIGHVDNILTAHSLRPHTLDGHMALYKAVLHHSGNALPKALLETIGVYVSLINECGYCVDHHFAGLQRMLKDDARAKAIRNALEAGADGADLRAEAFAVRERAALDYAARLTRAPGEIDDADMASLRDAGLDDGEILEINQVTAYFSYANRTVLGLGVTTDGDTLGKSPNNSADADDWSHT